MNNMKLSRDVLLQKIHQRTSSSTIEQFYSLLKPSKQEHSPLEQKSMTVNTRNTNNNSDIVSSYQISSPKEMFSPIHVKYFSKPREIMSSHGSSAELSFQVPRQLSQHQTTQGDSPNKKQNLTRLSQTLLNRVFGQQKQFHTSKANIVKGSKQEQQLSNKALFDSQDKSLHSKNKSLQVYDVAPNNPVTLLGNEIAQRRNRTSSSRMQKNLQLSSFDHSQHLSQSPLQSSQNNSTKHISTAKMTNHFFLGSRTSVKSDISQKESSSSSSAINSSQIENNSKKQTSLHLSMLQSQDAAIQQKNDQKRQKQATSKDNNNMSFSSQIHKSFADKQEVMRIVEQKLRTTLALSALLGNQQCMSPDKPSTPSHNIFLGSNSIPRRVWSRSKKHSQEMKELNAQSILEYKRKLELRKSQNQKTYSSSVFTASAQEEAFLSERSVLIIEIYNLRNVKSNTNLKYCYQSLPQISPKQLEVQQKKEFNIFKKCILRQLRITADDIFLYLKDGTPIYSHADIPRQEQTLFAGNCRVFSGIEKLFSSEANLESLKKIIEKLESRLATSIAEIQPTDIVLIPDSQCGTPSSSYLFGRVASPQLARHQSIPYFTTSSTPKESTYSPTGFRYLKQESPTKGQNKRSQFADYMKQGDSEQNSAPQSSALLEASSPFNTISDVNGYLKKVMKYLDLFFSKFDFNWRTDQEKIEIDLYLQRHLNYPKHIKKNNMINYKLKGFVQRKANLESLKMLNLDLFTHSIGGILKQFEMKESDLNCVYLLYRSILNIQSLIVSIEQVVKEDDVFTSMEKYDSFTQENLVIVQSLCQYKDIINWTNFVQVLNNISTRNAQQKIELFVKLFDRDSSGTLSYQEVSQLSYQTLQHIINQERFPIIFVELHQYLVKLLFASLKEEGQPEIPLEKIRSAILEQSECADLLCFFCGTEVAPEKIKSKEYNHI